MISRERLDILAAQTSFRPDTVERVVRLIDVLERISRDAFLGPRLALKGGTALNLFYLPLDRLSVDIDLNYVGSSDRDVMLREKSEIDRRVPALLASLGYKSLRSALDEHAGGKSIYRYTSAYGQNGTLEIDTNYLYRVPFFGTQVMASAPLGDYAAPKVTVVDLNEIAGGKLVALVSRKASRDLYDTWRLLDRTDLDWAKVKVATLAIGAAGRERDWRTASLDDYEYDLNELQSKLLRVVKRDALSSIGAPQEWCESVLTVCRERLAPIFQFDAGERAFLDAIYEEGRIDTTGLNIGDDIKARIAQFPALRWKAQNVREHLRSGASLKP